jgi:hypothetical protein
MFVGLVISPTILWSIVYLFQVDNDESLSRCHVTSEWCKPDHMVMGKDWTLWEKRMFCNWPCNSIFELHRTFATHCIYTLWVLLDNLQNLQNLQLTVYTVQPIIIQLQLCCNKSFSTTMQLPYDYNHDVMLMSLFIHPSKFNTWHYEDFSWFFKNIDIHHPLWLFVLDGFGLWHMAQSKVAMWHIN